ncbi:MAG: ABC transporter permease, partial [Flavisolibacter sp.]|nr:ABC transporter permease [Flavisolibacter sp.]
MIKNYFKIAWRNLGRHKGDTAINLVGLCVAFTCALLLFLSVYYEFSFDRFHKNAAHIYHVYFKTLRPEGEDLSAAMPVPLLSSLKQTYPEIKYGARYINTGGVVQYKDKKLTQNLKLTDPDFFSMFSFPFVKGDAQTALSGLNNLVLRVETAKALFDKEDPVGKTVQLQIGNEWKPFMVTGVVANFPENSTISYDMIIRFENEEEYQENTTRWDNWNHDLYIQLREGTKPEALERKTAPFIAEHFAEDIENLKRDGAKPAADGSYMQLKLQPFLNIHTDTQINAEGNVIGRNYLYLLLTIGVLIVLIACINFINLSIGRSFTRTQEIGLRKTLGAERWQLIAQFWTESFLLCLFALFISSVLSYFILPYYRQLFAMNIKRDILFAPLTWLGITAVFFVITAIAGGYPAWLISRFNIIQILKGKISIRRSQKLRNSLIVVQFTIAILLMVCTLVSWQQIDYLRSKPLGFNRSQVISIPVQGDLDPTQALERMRAKAAAYPAIESISGIYDNLGRGLDGSSRRSRIGFDYKNRTLQTVWMGVSYDFVKTLDLKLAEGRDFSRNFLTDSNAVVINEAMAQLVGEKNTVGTLLPFRENQPPKVVIGVVKNFNFESLRNKIEPLTLVLEKRFPINYILVKVKPDHLPASMQLLKTLWKEVAPDNEFKGSFLDENIERQYRREEKLGKIFIYGTGIAIVLSCMGLLAMVLLIVTQRFKEIGIRKVLGATVTNIVSLLAKDFLWLVLIAFVFAAPVGWYFMHQWLQDFAYRIQIQW